MFKGEKRDLFWLGLIILGFASVVLFAILWQFAVLDEYGNPIYMLKQAMPIIAGAIVFIFIGFYMMKSGVEKSSS